MSKLQFKRATKNPRGGGYWILYNATAKTVWTGRGGSASVGNARKFVSRQGAEIEQDEMGVLPSYRPVQLTYDGQLKKNPRRRRSKAGGALSRKHYAAAMRKKPKKNPSHRFGKKKRTLKSAVRKIAASHTLKEFVIRGKAKGQFYFFTGDRFDSIGSHAARYVDRATAAKVSRSIRGVLPHSLKSLEVVPL